MAVYDLAVERFENLDSRALIVTLRVGLIFKLHRNPRSGNLRVELVGALDGALHPLGSGREIDRRAVRGGVRFIRLRCRMDPVAGTRARPVPWDGKRAFRRFQGDIRPDHVLPHMPHAQRGDHRIDRHAVHRAPGKGHPVL